MGSRWRLELHIVWRSHPDYRSFLDALARAQERYPFRLFGHCLMPNHFHLLLRPEPGVSISRVLQSLSVAHTWRYHRQHGTVGHVWQGRFKSPVVQGDVHALTVLRYIEGNPTKIGRPAQSWDFVRPYNGWVPRGYPSGW